MTAAEPEGRILSAGLTGGIACGRTTVCGMLARRGAFVVDMDVVAHELVAPEGAAVPPVVEAFGPAVLDPLGGVNRKALGARVFSDAAARARLEAILHPMILERASALIAEFARAVARGVAVTDAALLVETGGYRRYQRLIAVTCDPVLQLQRLMKRDALNESATRARIAAQAPLAEKIALADYHIDTSETLARTEERVAEVWGMLLDDLESLPDLPRRKRA